MTTGLPSIITLDLIFPCVDATMRVFPLADGVGGSMMGIRITSIPFSILTSTESSSKRTESRPRTSLLVCAL
jgi:hypothetical protein